MHPGSVQGFGQLGRDGVPVFLLPANPVSALVVFEVMVRPLIRMSLGKRQPMRRVVQARTLSPITSVAGRKGYLRGPADARPGHRRVPGAGARWRAGRVVAPARDAGRGKLSGDRSRVTPNRSAPARSSMWPSSRNAADSTEPARDVEPLAFDLAAPGLADAGRSDPGARGCGAAAPGPAARRRGRGAGSGWPTGHLEPWEPVAEMNWEPRHAVSSWPSMCSGLRAEARRGRMLPYAIELDGQFCGQLTIGNVTHGALRSAWIGYWVAKAVTGGGVATAALALGLDHGFGAVMLHRIEATVRPENAASRAVLAKAGSARRGCFSAIWRSTALGAIICWSRSPSRSCQARQRRRWCARARASWT